MKFDRVLFEIFAYEIFLFSYPYTLRIKKSHSQFIYGTCGTVEFLGGGGLNAKF